MKKCEILIAGGGIAGMTASIILKQELPQVHIILIERESCLGGILRQCLHHGYGSRDLTGPEYEAEKEQQLRELDVEILCDTEVTEILETEDGLTAAIASPDGWEKIIFQKLFLSCGSYERPVGNLMISGSRPEGIFGAGELQRMINLEKYHPKKSAVIIGSGDIGMILARRLSLHGVEVRRIVEIKKESPALERNKKRCLEAFQLPLQVNARVSRIHGEKELCGVTVENLNNGEQEYVECELLAVAAGLIPDRTLAEGLSEKIKKHIVFLGNCEKIYPVADGIVHAVSEICREKAAEFRESFCMTNKNSEI